MSSKKSPITTYILIAILAVMAVLMGANYFFKPFSELEFMPEKQGISEEIASQEPIQNTVNVTDTQEEIEALVATFSPEDKIAQLIAVPIDAEEMSASMSALAEAVSGDTSPAYVGFLTGETTPTGDAAGSSAQPLFLENWGFATLFGSNISFFQGQKIISFLKETSLGPVPRWILVDHEGGSVQRFSGTGFTDLPSWQEQCQMQSEDRVALLTQSATELHDVGVDAVLAPMLDSAKNHPILKTRICSNEPLVIYEASTEFVSIFNEFKVLPVLKHFPGIGGAKKDLHTSFDTVTVTDDDVELYSTILDVYPYSGVMTSHVGVENQNATAPCSLSKDCVGQLYEKYPQVLTFTDALEMKATGVDNETVFLEDVALQAIEAGNTVLVFGDGVPQSELKIVHERLLREFHDSYAFREKINANVALVLRYKLAK